MLIIFFYLSINTTIYPIANKQTFGLVVKEMYVDIPDQCRLSKLMHVDRSSSQAFVNGM